MSNGFHNWAVRYIISPPNSEEAMKDDGDFDCVLALCSLYYLPEEDMLCVVRAMAERSPRFVFQCNIREGIGREESDQYRRASKEFAIYLLHEAGYSSINVTAPKGYLRPLVQGFMQSTPS